MYICIYIYIYIYTHIYAYIYIYIYMHMPGVVQLRGVLDRGERVLRLVHALEEVEVGPVLQALALDDTVLYVYIYIYIYI